jgi:hypothetical protein
MTIKGFMKVEFLYWYLLPTLIGLILLIFATRLILRSRNVRSIFFSSAIALILAFSQWGLIQIFFLDAWPTFLPHFGTGLATALLTIQIIWDKKSYE